MLYGILQFTSKSRVQGTGVPFIEYKTNKTYTVHTKKEYHKDVWAKIDPISSELIEIIGPTCEYQSEVAALRGVYRVYYKYPSHPILPYQPKTYTDRAYTVDHISTLDRDDAISVKKEVKLEGIFTIIGIHITDISKRLSDEWVSWALTIGSSAYWENGTKPIFPPALSHDILSLTKDKIYPCLSLFLTYDNNYELVKKEFRETDVFISDNLTYEQFSDPALSIISGKTEATEIVEWCMIQYNLYIAANLPDVLLRVQDENEPARYDYTGTHFVMDRLYAHATSPIRRFADFYNQCIYHNRDVILKEKQLLDLNKRMDEVRTFHQKEIVMRLAYEFKIPKVVQALVEIIEDGRSICLQMDGKRIWIPLSDTYYEEKISEKLEEGESYQVECFGIHKNGKATLRIRLIE
jgi:RNB domain